MERGEKRGEGERDTHSLTSLSFLSFAMMMAHQKLISLVRPSKYTLSATGNLMTSFPIIII